LQTILFLAAVGSVTAQYHVYENGEAQQNVGYDSPLSPAGSLTGTTYGGGKDIISPGVGGTYKFYPTVKYVTPQTTSYGEPVRNSYSDPTTYYGAGDYGGGIYDGGFGNGQGDHPQRVKIQVSQDRHNIYVNWQLL
jgi:hypothetical protein